ncbi:MAG: hypothetical protein QX198_08935, partial [Methylococcaceae bacterium]
KAYYTLPMLTKPQPGGVVIRPHNTAAGIKKSLTPRSNPADFPPENEDSAGLYLKPSCLNFSSRLLKPFLSKR